MYKSIKREVHIIFFYDIGPRAAAMVPTTCTSMQKAIANSVAVTAGRCFACSE